jgi:hypothetical protein
MLERHSKNTVRFFFFIYRKRAPKLDQGYFSWVGPVWSCPDNELFEKIGLDAVVFIRFLRMCRNVFFVMAIVGCGALIPINVIATKEAKKAAAEKPQPDGQPAPDAAPKDTVSMLTMQDVEDPKWLWAHVGGAWFFSLVMYFAMHHGYRTFLQFRTKYFESETYQEEVASRTIMLAGLPSSLQTDDKLFKFMNDMGFSDKPVQALVGRKVNKLPELMDKHKKMVEQLEKVVARYFAGKLQPRCSGPMTCYLQIGYHCKAQNVNTLGSVSRHRS